MEQKIVPEMDRRQKTSVVKTMMTTPPKLSPFRSSTEFQRFIELSRDGVVVVQEETIVALNQSAADMCGRTINDWVGQSVSLFNELIPLDMNRLIADILSGRSPIIKNQRTEIKHRNGQNIPIFINGGSFTFNDVPAVLFVITDQTSKLRTEGDIQKTRHLESIAALSGGIAHDYNNLLTVIIGNISLIQSYVDPNDIISRLLNEAQEASMVAKSLTQKLITFSRGGSPVKETADMAALLQVVTEFSLSGSNIKCHFDIPDNLALVDIDKTQVSQAMHNLVMNARDAMPNGGILTVSASNVQNIDAKKEYATGKFVKISISDRGTGIPPENLEKIYDPYFSTKERGHEKGTGLGLSICHSIIQKHEGIMEIESSMGEGTVVHIYLPASEKPEIIETIDQNSHPEPLGIESGCGRILVMDDEDMITKMAGRILARLGYEAEFARDGGEALEVYQNAMQSNFRFDAVILDLTVRGGMGGEEAVQQLLKMDPTVKAIVSSGYSDSPVMHNFTDYGFCGAVVKPYSLNELGQALNRALNLETQVKTSDI